MPDQDKNQEAGKIFFSGFFTQEQIADIAKAINKAPSRPPRRVTPGCSMPERAVGFIRGSGEISVSVLASKLKISKDKTAEILQSLKRDGMVRTRDCGRKYRGKPVQIWSMA